MIRRPPRSTPLYSSAASDVYKRQGQSVNWRRSNRKPCKRSGCPLSLIHISEPTRQAEISYAVFCLKKKKKGRGPIKPDRKTNGARRRATQQLVQRERL